MSDELKPCPHLKVSHRKCAERAAGMTWEGDRWACDACGVAFMSCEWRVVETDLTPTITWSGLPTSNNTISIEETP